MEKLKVQYKYSMSVQSHCFEALVRKLAVPGLQKTNCFPNCGKGSSVM